MLFIIYLCVVLVSAYNGSRSFWVVIYLVSIVAGVVFFYFEHRTSLWDLIAYVAICGYVCRNGYDRIHKGWL